MQHLEGSGTPVLYIGRKVLKGKNTEQLLLHASVSFETILRELVNSLSY
jgi:hypothetical protein